MKSFISFAAICLSLASSTLAFVPISSYSPRRVSLSMSSVEMTPDLEAAIAEVRVCASSFSDETAHFANVWIDKMIEGNMEGTAAGLLEECVLEDSDRCEKFSNALTKLDGLLGVVAGEQY